MKKKLFLALLVLVAPLIAKERDFTLYPPNVPAPHVVEADPPQTNTFCASNLSCAVTGAWSFSNISTLTVSGTATLAKINNVVYLDGVTNTTLATCYAAIPSAGGKCVVPPNYTETLSASLTMNKANSGFEFAGPATITMGTNKVIVTAGTHGAFLYGTIPYGGASHTLGARFIYSGNSNAFQVGTNVTATREFSLKNITITFSSATAGAVGIYMTQVIYFDIQNPSVIGELVANTTGLVCDGSGATFCGTGTIINPQFVFLGVGLLGTGTCATCMQNTVIMGGTISSPGSTGAIGIDIEQGNSNLIVGTDVESNSIALKLGAGAGNNRGWIRSEANTTDAQALAGSSSNTFQFQTQPTGTSIVKSDAGSLNNLTRMADTGAQTYYSSSANGEPVLIDTLAGTSQKYIQLGNTGNATFYLGLESSVSGAFFTGSQAYDSVIYGGNNDIYLHTGASNKIRFAALSISPNVAGAGDFGTALLPAGNLWLGTAATNNFKFQPAAIGQATAMSLLDPKAATVAVSWQGGIPCTNGELVLSAGWGTTATVTAVVGLGWSCEWTVTSSGTGQAANPTLTDTLVLPVLSASVACEMRMVGGTGTATLIDQTTLSATAPIFTFLGTPVAASTYKVYRRC